MIYAVWYFFLVGFIAHPISIYVLYRSYRMLKQ